MIKKFKFPLLIAALIGLAMCLSGCDLVVFNPKGLIAEKEKNLIIISTLLMLIVVLPVILMTVLFCWRYRASNEKAKYSPEWDGSVALELLWWAVPLVIIGILAVITWVTSHDLDPYKPLDSKKAPVTVQAISLEWKWLFVYPDQDIATINYLVIPEQTPINVEVTSNAPMNSLWIPALTGQIYAMNGMRTKIHFIANETGVYDGLSSGFSGDGFTGMKFDVKSTTQEGFDQWVSTVKQSPNALTIPEYNRLIVPSEDDAVKYYSSAEDDLYDKIVMHFMMPEDTGINLQF